ncbi:MAG: ABC transporter ATP-binding protein [Candidatus Dormibacteria bacterium]
MNRHWTIVFPRGWREQYGEDMAVNLAHTRLGFRAILDIMRGAVLAWLHPRSRPFAADGSGIDLALIDQSLLDSQPAVRLVESSRFYRSADVEVAAVVDASLVVRRGESVALMGPSGSGKTTLLNLIAGLDRASAGGVWVLGRSLTDLSEAELTGFRADNLGLVFQEPHLLAGLSALENVIVARLPWEPRAVLEPRAKQLLEGLGLGGRMGFPPGRLSGGEVQRVGIARALLADPALMVADEPTGNLDAAQTTEVLHLLQGLRDSLGLTLIVATHDPEVAAAMERTILISGGRVLAA